MHITCMDVLLPVCYVVMFQNDLSTAEPTHIAVATRESDTLLRTLRANPGFLNTFRV